MTSARTFGITQRGPAFDFGVIGPDGEPMVKTFHARAGITFPEQLDYLALKSRLTHDALVGTRKQTEALKAVDTSADDALEKMEAIAQTAIERERQRWDVLTALVVMLVEENDREQVGEMLEKAPLADIAALRDWLEQVVVDRVTEEVEAVGRVDPTSPSQPSGSSDNPTTGPAPG